MLGVSHIYVMNMRSAPVKAPGKLHCALHMSAFADENVKRTGRASDELRFLVARKEKMGVPALILLTEKKA